jgi:hypothetical protein
MQENPEAFKMRKDKMEFDYGIGTIEVRGGSPNSGLKRIPNFIWAGIALVFLILGWYFVKFLGLFG